MRPTTVLKWLAVLLVATLALGLLLIPGCKHTPAQVSTEPTTTTAPTTTTEPTTPPVVPPTTTPEPTSTPTVKHGPGPNPTPGTPVNIYLVRGEKLGVAGRTALPLVTSLARSAMNHLLLAPSREDRVYGLTTAIPSGTKVLGLTISKGIATVDLTGRFESGGGSFSMRMRVAQVVHTLTQFPSVRRVAFRIDGKPVKSIGGEGVVVSPPVGRAQFEDMSPSILVESPVPGQRVARPLRLAGTANVFEAQFNARLLGAKGKIVGPEIAVHATSGSGTRGTFSTPLAYSSSAHGPAKLQVFDRSEKDGSIEDLTTILVDLP